MLAAFVCLFALTMIVWAIVVMLSGVPRSPRARALHYAAALLLIYGCIGFFGQAAVAATAFFPSALEWPVLFPASSARDSSGNTVLGLAPAGRVQIYDPSGRFVRGWSVEAGGGSLKLWVTPADEIEVFTARGQKRLLYARSGALLRADSYSPRSFADLPGGVTSETKVRSFWLLWPLASPMIAWALFALGLLGLLGSERLERRARRRLARAKNAPKAASTEAE